MTTIGIPPRSRADWDVPAAAVEADAKARALAEAYKHRPEPFEVEFADLATTHPKACTRDADWPGWAEHIAALADLNRKTKPRSTT